MQTNSNEDSTKPEHSKQPNKHGDHEATCLCCKHVDISGIDTSYSEWTPGIGTEYRCAKGHYELITEYSFDDEKRHNLLLTGKFCPDFEAP